jgi:heme-degrading monooxygenase HmoA
MITSVITEQAVLDVRQGREAEFEAAFERAKAIIASMPGFEGLRLLRCLETPHRYLLLVEWARLEDHTVGFRVSAEYEEWKALLHHFYDPFPRVEHFADISAG